MNKTLFPLEAIMCATGYDAVQNAKPSADENQSDPWHEASMEISAIEKRRRKNQKRLKDQMRERNSK